MMASASNIPSRRPPALTTTREERMGAGAAGAAMAAAAAAAAATAVLSPVDLAQNIERMKEQNQQLSKSLKTFLDESSLLSTGNV